MNIRQALQSRFSPSDHIRLNDVDVDPESIRAVLISEVVPDDPAQDFYGRGDGSEAYLSTTLPLFRQAGIDAHSIADILHMGVYITGGNLLIEKSKVRMITDDLATMAHLIR